MCYVPSCPLIGDAIVADDENAELTSEYLTSRIETLRRVAEGRSSAGIACEEELAALAFAENLAKQYM